MNMINRIRQIASLYVVIREVNRAVLIGRTNSPSFRKKAIKAVVNANKCIDILLNIEAIYKKGD